MKINLKATGSQNQKGKSVMTDIKKFEKYIIETIDYFKTFKWRVTEPIKIEYKSIDEKFPIRLAAYNQGVLFRPEEQTNLNPFIELYFENIDKFINQSIKVIPINSQLNKKSIQELVKKIIIYHETIHWIIDCAVDSSSQKYNYEYLYNNAKNESIDTINFQEALANYFTWKILSMNHKKNSIDFFERLCESRALEYYAKNNEEYGRAYLLWRKDESDGFELRNFSVEQVVRSTELCRQNQEQSWKTLKSHLTP
jgi:hypothetical protein